MTKKEKDLLLKDLCARLPYGVKVHAKYTDTDVEVEKVGVLSVIDADTVVAFTSDDTNYYNYYVSIHEVKPYLFPLSSMTKEQRKECFEGTPLEIDKYGDVAVKDDFYGNSQYTDLEIYLEVIDWLNKNHFDYMGLIEKELAINAVGLNIY